ncbi:MAG: transcription termination/antitermination protein NusA, partial [Nitratireductor sp.]|nr:transcription termination/antitermination protein NusA [Nitratireductor sp.]
SQLTGWDIDIMTEQEESERRQAEFVENTRTFMEALNVDEMVAQLLASEGFSSVEEVAYVDQDEIASIEGFDDDTAEELQARAREFLDRQEAELDEERKKLGVADDLRQVEGMTTAMMVALGKSDDKVLTLEDFAGCTSDDLIGWTERKAGETQRFPGILDGFNLSRVDAEQMIMDARLKAGWVTEEDLAPPAEEEAEGDEASAEEAEAPVAGA